MRFDARDYFGAVVVIGALALVAIHQSDRHQAWHASSEDGPAAADASGQVTVFADFRMADGASGATVAARTVVVRDSAIAWVGPSSEATIPPHARVVRGDGTQLLFSAVDPDDPTRRTLRPGDPANVIVLSADPLVRPAALEAPLCVMRQGVVVSLAPSLDASG